MSPDSPVPSLEAPPENLVSVGSYATYAAGAEHGLVVLACGFAYWLEPVGDGWQLRVEPEAGPAVLEQLARFDRESVGWPPPPLDATTGLQPIDLLTPALWAAAVLAVFRAEAAVPGLIERGGLDAQAVFDRGEVWRLATALFLHADAAHLLSNLVSGIFIFSAVTSTIGRRRGWLLLALAAVVGNLASAFAHHPEPYLSVGASTAIFGGLGLLTGRAARIAVHASAWERWRAMFAPIAAGITVLALYGSGGAHVDLGAHLCGFTAGLPLGGVVGRTTRSAQA